MFPQTDPLVLIAGAFFAVTLLAFSIGFLINWYRNRAVMASYKRIGFYAAVIVAVFELLTLALSARSLFFLGASFIPIVLAIGWLMLRIWAFTNNGIFYSNKLRLRSFPLIAPRLGTEVEPEAVVAPVPTIDPVADSADALAAPSLPDTLVESPVTTETLTAEATPATPLAAPVAPMNWRNYWLTTLAVGLGAVVYSVILFAVTLPAVGSIFRDVVGSGTRVTPLALVMILEFAFNEEIFFRLGIQNYLAAKLINRRRGYEIAIVLTTILWTLGHVGSLDPDWVKLVQVFPVGLALGWLYRRNGTESAIIAHSLFNLVGAFVINIG